MDIYKIILTTTHEIKTNRIKIHDKNMQVRRGKTQPVSPRCRLSQWGDTDGTDCTGTQGPEEASRRLRCKEGRLSDHPTLMKTCPWPCTKGHHFPQDLGHVPPK